MQRLAWIAVVAACGGAPSSAVPDGPGGDATASMDGGTDGATDGGTDGATDAAPVQPVCTGSECECTDGYRPCTGGCCTVNLDTVTFAGAWGDSVRMHVAPDGTAYVLVDQRTPQAYQLRLYARAPSGAITDTGWTAPVDYYQGMFDFAIRSDGTLLIAFAPIHGESAAVELVTWKNGVASMPVTIGSGFGYDLGVSAALDGDETLWVTWSSARSGGMSAYSLDTGGTQRVYSLASNGTIEETDAEYSAALGSVFSFYGHRYTGTFVSGVDRLAGTATLAATCPADSAAFDSAGHLWSIYNTYSSIHTYTCLDGDSVEQPSVFGTTQIAVDAEDIAYTANYDATAYTATWYASPNNHGWTHGIVPTHFGVPQGWSSPGQAHVALAPDGHGNMSIVVVPEAAEMGAMVLATFR